MPRRMRVFAKCLRWAGDVTFSWRDVVNVLQNPVLASQFRVRVLRQIGLSFRLCPPPSPAPAAATGEGEAEAASRGVVFAATHAALAVWLRTVVHGGMWSRGAEEEVRHTGQGVEVL